MHSSIKHISPNNLLRIAAWAYTLFLIGISIYPLPDLHWAHGSDKTVHFFMYFFLFVLWKQAVESGTWRLAAALILLGIMVEVLQAVLPLNRTGDVWDATANALGVLTALYVCRG